MLPKGILKEYSRALALLIRFLDMLIMFLTGWWLYWIKFGIIGLTLPYLFALFIGSILITTVFSFSKIYSSVRGRNLFNYFLVLFQGMGVTVLLLAGFAFFTKSGEIYSRLWLLTWMIAALSSIVLLRLIVLFSLRFMRSVGLNERRIIIIGAGEVGVKLAQTVQEALWTGYRIVALMDNLITPSFVEKVPLLPLPAHLGNYLSQEKIDEVWLALPLKEEERIKNFLHELRHHTINARLVLDIFGLELLNHSLMDLAGFPVLSIRSSPMIGLNRLLKAAEDRILAGLILLLTSPLFLILSIAIKFSSPGPIFYRQLRIGWNGQEFKILKFRTMPVNAEKKTGPVWASREDGRATKLGSFLRRTSLDELPQLINVLKGEMSIVGPRPERKVFVEEFKEKIPLYMQKHLVKAGMTGWAQVNGWRGNTCLEKRIEHDLYYIEHWSLSFDIKIILLTLFRGFFSRHAY